MHQTRSNIMSHNVPADKGTELAYAVAMWAGCGASVDIHQAAIQPAPYAKYKCGATALALLSQRLRRTTYSATAV